MFLHLLLSPLLPSRSLCLSRAAPLSQSKSLILHIPVSHTNGTPKQTREGDAGGEQADKSGSAQGKGGKQQDEGNRGSVVGFDPRTGATDPREDFKQ